jgi:hypothetical protein
MVTVGILQHVIIQPSGLSVHTHVITLDVTAVLPVINVFASRV